MLDHFRRNCRFDSRTNTREAPGSSFPTYQGQNENGEPAAPSAPSSNESQKPSSKNRKAECCGGYHKGGYDECYYLHPWKRPETWKPHKWAMKKLQEALKNSEKLQKMREAFEKGKKAWEETSGKTWSALDSIKWIKA